MDQPMRAPGWLHRLVEPAQDLIRRAKRQRRGYPSPDDFRRMTQAQATAYFKRIGLLDDIERISAEHPRRSKPEAEDH